MKIVDDQDRDLPLGEVGEILVRGPNVMKGYWKRAQETAEALRGGWFHTGDLGRVDEDGYFYIVDRKKDLILVGGMNVYPREVEEVLYAHPGVAEACVVGVRDPLRGEVPKAFLALREGALKLLAPALVAVMGMVVGTTVWAVFSTLTDLIVGFGAL